MALSAADLVRFFTDGTATFAAPDDTTIVIVSPLCAVAPAPGSVRITLPAGTESDASFVVVVLNPATPSAFAASAADLPETSGTGMGVGPFDTVSVIGAFF